jgi:hypothetical protein
MRNARACSPTEHLRADTATAEAPSCASPRTVPCWHRWRGGVPAFRFDGIAPRPQTRVAVATMKSAGELLEMPEGEPFDYVQSVRSPEARAALLAELIEMKR